MDSLVCGSKRMRDETRKSNCTHSAHALQCLERALETLPIDCVETTCVDVTCDDNDQLYHSLAGDVVIAPHVIAADQVFVRKLPRRARPGTTFRFELVFNDTSPSARKLVTSLALHTHVDVVLHSAHSTHVTVILLVATLTPLLVSPDVDGFGVSVCIAIPELEQSDASKHRLCINRIAIAGESLQKQDQANVTFPLSFDVIPGMFTPQTLQLELDEEISCMTPVIASDGTLYLPMWNSPIVAVFDGDGVALPPLVLSDFGLSRTATFAALDNSSHTLLLGDYTFIVAIDTLSRTMLWKKQFYVFGITVLQGIVLVNARECIFALRPCDGAILSLTHQLGCVHLTSDAATATVYLTSTGGFVSTAKWNSEQNALVFGVTPAFPRHDAAVPYSYVYSKTTVVPSRGCSPSYFVQIINNSTLHVSLLPDCRLVCVHSRPSMVMRGVAADPSGTALAVYDALSATVHVLPWPLPGMLDSSGIVTQTVD
jgi:hypothetical protein